MKDKTKTFTTIDFVCAGIFAATSILNFCTGNIWLGIATAGMCVICLTSGMDSRAKALAK